MVRGDGKRDVGMGMDERGVEGTMEDGWRGGARGRVV